MKVQLTEARSILTAQRGGFLTAPPYPFTHTLAAYTGCAFGSTTCGMYCYAQHLPNWAVRKDGNSWGSMVLAKYNAPELLETTLRRMSPDRRRMLRIFMSATTDPYQSPEARLRLTRGCLEVFARYLDLDLLVLQTRSVLAARDLDLLATIPYAWLSVTIESDDPAVYQGLRGGPKPAARFDLVRASANAGVSTQIAVSPCMPYSDQFAERLSCSGAQRIIVDTFVDGDGSHGARTNQSTYASVVPATQWRDTTPAHRLYAALLDHEVPVGWSTAGFCGIPPRSDRLV